MKTITSKIVIISIVMLKSLISYFAASYSSFCLHINYINILDPDLVQSLMILAGPSKVLF